ncbi:MAG: inositol monophosphatase family protein [Methanomassiliicoccales archaeon]
MKEEFIKIANAVREAVMPVAGTPEAREIVGKGADGAASFKIDRTAENAALNAIKDLGLKFNILTEETGFVDGGGTETIVIDPVDGSRNAINGLPMYSFSIAVGSRGLSGMREGLVMDLQSGRVYFAEKGLGATCDNRSIRTREYNERGSIFLLNLGANASTSVLDFARRSAIVRSYGSAALEMCLVAEGRADLYVNKSIDSAHSMRIVDIAAAALILREAGGEIYDTTGNLLDMELRIDDRKGVIAVGDKNLRRMVV